MNRGARIRLGQCAAWLVAVALAPPATQAEILLPQADGTTLAITRPAKRVITLAPNLAEMVYAAGAGETLVATVEFSDYPPPAAALPRIGDAFRFDLERIMSFEPDLVLAWDSGNPAVALERLQVLGLKVWRTEARNPGDIAGILELVARATGREQQPAAAGVMRDRIRRLESRHGGDRPVRYFYQVSARPLFTLNGEHLVSRGLAICGGRNVFADQGVLAPQVSREAVLRADPEVLIAPVVPGQDDPLEHWRSWPRMTAVRNDSFVRLAADEISRATPRMLDSLETACARLHLIRQQKKWKTNS